MRVWIGIGCVVCCAIGYAAEPCAETADRFVQQISLPKEQLAVISEGDCEARAAGSYAVRLYARNADGGAPTYLSGVVLARDGQLDDVLLADLTGYGNKQIVVVLRTGATRAAQALAVVRNKLEVRSSVTDLAPGAEVVAAMTRTTRSDKASGKGEYHGPKGGVRQ